MSNNSSKFPSWWSKDDIEIARTYFGRPSSLDSEYCSKSDGILIYPTKATVETPIETPTQVKMMPGISTELSQEVRNRKENGSPETARYVALRMYQSMKRLGLTNEANKAFTREHKEIQEIKQGAVGERKNKEELIGMDYLLKDGFVSCLHHVARITPPIPQQVLRFSGIKCSRKHDTSENGYETFGNKVVGCFTRLLQTTLQKNNTTKLQILNGVDGYIMPGSVTLLLGPPGSGKSALLEILAGRVAETEESNLEGVVMYNDKRASDIRLSRLIAYVCGQLNKRIPFLSVRKTLEFARDCNQGLRPENFTPQEQQPGP